jgi:hypothetical protein
MNKHITRRRIIAVTAATTLVVGGSAGAAAAIAGSSHAVAPAANVCHSSVQENVQWPLDTSFRVVAWCDSLDAGTLVRGVLNTKWDVDKQTDWFSETGVKHYSDWKIPIFGITPTSRVEYSAG